MNSKLVNQLDSLFWTGEHPAVTGAAERDEIEALAYIVGSGESNVFVRVGHGPIIRPPKGGRYNGKAQAWFAQRAASSPDHGDQLSDGADICAECADSRGV